MGEPFKEYSIEELDEHERLEKEGVAVTAEASAHKEYSIEELDEHERLEGLPVAEVDEPREYSIEELDARAAQERADPAVTDIEPPPGTEVVKLGKHGLWEPPGAIVGKWAKHVGLPLPPVQTFKPHEEVPVGKGVTEILRATGTLETGVSPVAKYLLDEEVAAIERKREEVQARAKKESSGAFKLIEQFEAAAEVFYGRPEEVSRREFMLDAAAKARGLQKAVLRMGPTGRMVEPTLYEDFGRAVYGYIATPGNILANALPALFGARGLIPVDADPNKTGWLGIMPTFVSSVVSVPTEAVTMITEDALWQSKRSLIDAKGNFIKPTPGHAEDRIRDTYRALGEFANKTVSAYLARNPAVVELFIEQAMRGVVTTAGPSIPWGFGRRNLATARSDGPGMVSGFEVQFPAVKDRPIDWHKLKISTAQEVPGALFLPVHLLNMAGTVGAHFAGPGTNKEKLEATTGTVSEISKHMGDRLHLLLTDRFGELAEEGVFKALMDWAMVAGIPTAVARSMARSSMARAQNMMGGRNANPYLPKATLIKIENGEYVFHRIKDYPSPYAPMLVAEEEVRLGELVLGKEMKFTPKPTLVKAEQYGDPRWVSAVERAERKLNPQQAVDDIIEVDRALSKARDAVGAATKGMGPMVKRMKRFANRLAKNEMPTTVHTILKDIVNKEGRKRALKILDPYRIKIGEGPRKKYPRPSELPESVQVELVELWAKQGELDILAMPGYESTISELNATVTTLVRDLFERQAVVEAVNKMRELIPRRLRTIPNREALKKNPKALRHVEDALIIEDVARILDQAAHWALPVVGQISALNAAKEYIAGGPGTMFWGWKQKGAIRRMWVDPEKRAIEAVLAGRRRAAGESGFMASRLESLLQRVPEENWPTVRDGAKFLADEVDDLLVTKTPDQMRAPDYVTRDVGEIIIDPKTGERVWTDPASMAKHLNMTPEELTRAELDLNRMSKLTPEELAGEAADKGIPVSLLKSRAQGESEIVRLLRMDRDDIAALAKKRGIPVTPEMSSEHIATLLGGRFRLKPGVEPTPDILKKLAIHNKYDDIIDYQVEVHKKALEADALYAPEKADVAYYPEVSDKSMTMSERISDLRERVAGFSKAVLKRDWDEASDWYHSRGTIAATIDDIETMGAVAKDHAAGISIAANHFKKMINPETGKKYTIAEREAGILYEGKRYKISDRPSDEILIKIPESMYELELLKAFNEMATDPASHQAFRRQWDQGEYFSMKEAEKTLRKGIEKGDADMVARAEDLIHDIRLREQLSELGWVEFSTRVGEGMGGATKHTGDFYYNGKGELVGIRNRHVPGTNKNVLQRGKLNGMVHPDIAYELAGTYELALKYKSLSMAATGFFKATKTIGAISTHMTNWLGNILFLAPMAGMSMWDPRSWKYYRKAYKDFASQVDSPLYQRWIRSAGLGPAGTIGRAEFIRDAHRGIGRIYKGIFGNAKHVHRNVAGLIRGIFTGNLDLIARSTGGIGNQLFSIPFGMYAVADNIHRYANFLKVVDEGGGLVRRNKALDSKGAMMGRYNFADYEHLSGAFQVIRSGLLGQMFVAFDAKMIPKTMSRMLTNPTQTRVMFGLHEYMVEMNRYSADIDTDYLMRAFNNPQVPDAEKYQIWLTDVFPTWMADAANVDIRDWRIDPLKYVPGMRRMPGVSDNAFTAIGRAFGADHPFFSTIMYGIFGMETYFRGAVYKETDSLDYAIEKVIKRMVQVWIPPDLFGLGGVLPKAPLTDWDVKGWSEERVERAKRGEIPFLESQPMSVYEEQLGRFSGLNANKWTPDRLLEIGDARLHFKLNKLSKAIGSLEYQFMNNKINQDRHEKEHRHLMKELDRLIEEAQENSALKEYLVRERNAKLPPERKFDPEKLKYLSVKAKEAQSVWEKGQGLSNEVQLERTGQ